MKISVRQSLTSGADFIHIMDCLSEKDMQTGRRHEELFIENINEDLDYLSVKVQRATIKSSTDFFNLIEKVISADYQKAPMICIHGHGDKSKGLLVGTEYIGWHRLINSFGKIMKEKNGNLTVFALFCHSFQLISHLREQEKLINYHRNDFRYLPFAYYYGYEKKIKAGKLQDETDTVFRGLLKPEHPELFRNMQQLHIKGYSELQYCMEKISSLLYHFTYSQHSPYISKKKVRKQVIQDTKDLGISFQYTRKFLKNLKNNHEIIFSLIDKLMYPTERRNLFKVDLLNKAIRENILEFKFIE